jgi:hypothetical protein
MLTLSFIKEAIIFSQCKGEAHDAMPLQSVEDVVHVLMH